MRYYLRFSDLEVLVDRKGRWYLYLRRPCSNLDANTLRCNVRNIPQHPIVCRQYNPYNCWYKRALPEAAEAEVIRLDRGRLNSVLEKTRFDECEYIAYLPSFDEIRSVLISPRDGDAHHTKPSVSRESTPLLGPCADCDAFCCTHVVVPADPPRTIGDIDYMKYLLGFPGVAIAVERDRWALVVRSTCVHLDETERRCKVVDQPARPKHCEFLDPWRCHLKTVYVVHQERRHWLELSDFEALARALKYDRSGEIVGDLSFGRFEALVSRPGDTS